MTVTVQTDTLWQSELIASLPGVIHGVTRRVQGLGLADGAGEGRAGAEGGHPDRVRRGGLAVPRGESSPLNPHRRTRE